MCPGKSVNNSCIYSLRSLENQLASRGTRVTKAILGCPVIAVLGVLTLYI